MEEREPEQEQPRVTRMDEEHDEEDELSSHSTEEEEDFDVNPMIEEENEINSEEEEEDNESSSHSSDDNREENRDENYREEEEEDNQEEEEWLEEDRMAKNNDDVSNDSYSSEEEEEMEEERDNTVQNKSDAILAELMEPLEIKEGELETNELIAQYNARTFPKLRSYWKDTRGTKFVRTTKKGVYQYKLKNRNQVLPLGDILVTQKGQVVRGRVRTSYLKIPELVRDQDHEETKRPSQSVVCGVCEIDFY